MSRNEKDALPPTYTEINTSRGQNILDQLTLTRAHHIQAVIDGYIIPLVEQQAAYGIAQTTIALLPSDIPLPPVEEKSEFSFDTGNVTPVEVIGFSSGEAPKVVRLEGQMNRIEFWRPQAIIEKLERVLKESLNANSRLRSPTGVMRPERNEFEPMQQHQQPKRTLLSRFVPSMGSEQRLPNGASEIGVKQMEGTGVVLVKVRLEEICLRTVTEFGLYDTMSRQCVIIRVDARC